MARNLAIGDRVRGLAAQEGPTPAQRTRLEENVAAVDVGLTAEDLERAERAAPRGVAAGERRSPEMLELTDR